MIRIVRPVLRRASCALVGCLVLAGSVRAGDEIGIAGAAPPPVETMLAPEPACGPEEAAPATDDYHHHHFVPAIVPAPIGFYAHNVFQLEADLAKAERLVIYREEWVTGTTRTKDCALYHLDEITDWIIRGRKPHSTYPVRVEPIGDPVIDQARRTAVVSYMTAHGVKDADQRVSLYPPSAEGLRWDSIDRLFFRGFAATTGGILTNNQNQNNQGGGGGGPGFGTTGFSGGSTFVPSAVGGTFRSPF